MSQPVLCYNSESVDRLGLGLGLSIIIISLQQKRDVIESKAVWKDQEEFRSEIGLEVTSRDIGSSWCIHSVHMYNGD